MGDYLQAVLTNIASRYTPSAPANAQLPAHFLDFLGFDSDLIERYDALFTLPEDLEKQRQTWLSRQSSSVTSRASIVEDSKKVLQDVLQASPLLYQVSVSELRHRQTFLVEVNGSIAAEKTPQ